MKIELKEGKKAYFVSDAHFGLPSHGESLKREKLMVKWLDETRDQAQAYFLVGDIFDFWWEYKRSVPRGFSRVMGRLGEISDSGTPIHFFWGNHDMWCRHDYLEEELGVIMHKDELEIEISGKHFFIHHGDGLGGKDPGYKFLKWAFRNRALQWGFSQLHPDFGQWVGHTWSSHRKYGQMEKYTFWGEKEFLVEHARERLKEKHYDYFVHGHRHTPVIFPVAEGSVYVNTGDWLQHFTFGEFDGENFKLLNYPEREDFSSHALNFAVNRSQKK